MKLLLLLSFIALVNSTWEFLFFGRDRCYAPTHLPGPQCMAMIPRMSCNASRCHAISFKYTFDSEKGCTLFIYGGCNPSPNNFETLEECRNQCEIMPLSD